MFTRGFTVDDTCDDDDDDVHLKKITTGGVRKSNPTQKCRLAKGISKRVNIQTKKYTDTFTPA
jgi:hypothetical protein